MRARARAAAASVLLPAVLASPLPLTSSPRPPPPNHQIPLPNVASQSRPCPQAVEYVDEVIDPLGGSSSSVYVPAIYDAGDYWEIRDFDLPSALAAPKQAPCPAAYAPRPPKLPARNEIRVAGAKALVKTVRAARAALYGAALLAHAAALAVRQAQADQSPAALEAAARRATVACVVAAAKARAALEIEAREASASVVAKAITRIKLHADLRAALAPFLDDDTPEAPLPAAAAAAEEQDEAASVASDVMQVCCCFLLAPAGLSHNSLAHLQTTSTTPQPFPPHQ
jgi:hypothetical protein